MGESRVIIAAITPCGAVGLCRRRLGVRSHSDHHHLSRRNDIQRAIAGSRGHNPNRRRLRQDHRHGRSAPYPATHVAFRQSISIPLARAPTSADARLLHPPDLHRRADGDLRRRSLPLEDGMTGQLVSRPQHGLRVIVRRHRARERHHTRGCKMKILSRLFIALCCSRRTSWPSRRPRR